MTESADLVLRNGRVHALAVPDPGDPRTWPGALAPDAPDGPPEPDATAVAVRDGEIVAVGSDRAVRRRAGVETREIDLDGATLLPGFVDAHTHLDLAGLSEVHADLRDAGDREAALDLLAEHAEAVGSIAAPAAESDDDWVIGLGYDESDWPGGVHPTRADLDAIADDRPVAAVRVDLHTAVLNSVALDLLEDPDPEHVNTDEGGDPTGLVREGAVDVVEPVFDPDPAATERAIRAAIDLATSRGITCVHDKVRESYAPRIYRALDRAGDLDCRVRIDYWADHLDALAEVGLRTGDGTDRVQVGSLKTFTDGSIGGRSAKLREPYADANGEDSESGDAASGDCGGGDRGTWVVEPAKLRELVADADRAGLQLQAHAIGDAAIGETIDAYESLATDCEAEESGDEGVAAERHRIEHAELATDAQIEAMAASGIVASMQPNFHRWARDGGLYETALGPERTRRTNRLRTVALAGVPLAFGSDGMPMDPRFGVEQALTAPTEAQSLSVGAALVAYTGGAAYAGFDEDRLGSIEVGKRADLVALDGSPWDDPRSISDVDVALTVVDGLIVHRSTG